MERPYEVICIRYYYGILPRYKDEIFVRQKSLHMCPTSTLYITYGKLWSDVHRTVRRRSNVWWDGTMYSYVTFKLPTNTTPLLIPVKHMQLHPQHLSLLYKISKDS